MSAGLMPGAEWLPLLAELAAKATLILLLAAAASALLWRASAAVRHLVWCVAVIGVLALPVFSVVLPAWELPLLPSSQAAAVTPPATILPQPGVHADVPAEALSAEPLPVADAPAGVGAWLPRAAAGVVAAGVLAGLLWLALGFWGVARMGRRAQVVHDPEWLRSAHEAAEQLQLRRPVLLLRDRGAVMPATGGLLWPTVVLPANADQWADDRRRAVLAHELAHVKRFDTLTQALAQVACALFWWHPAVWYAARRLRVERERACDDLVLRTGTRASDYASHLLEIARAQRSPWLALPALVSMARPSQLESRLLWVLDAARSRGVPSAGAKLLAAVAGVLIVGSLAAVRPVEAVAAGGSSTLADAGAAVKVEGRLRSTRLDDGRAKEKPKDDAAKKLSPASALAQTDTPPARATIDGLIGMRAVGVTGAYIRELAEVGLTGLSARRMTDLRAHRIDAAYVRELRAAGFADLNADQLIRLRASGVDRDQARGRARTP
jgi:beta-lactamase regulating signal transducer with metallopeptidase domain